MFLILDDPTAGGKLFVKFVPSQLFRRLIHDQKRLHLNLVRIVKITGNSHTWDKLRDHMDVNVSSILDGTETLPSAGKRVFNEIIEVASGKKTKAEISGYTRAMDIYMIGPVI